MCTVVPTSLRIWIQVMMGDPSRTWGIYRVDRVEVTPSWNVKTTLRWRPYLDGIFFVEISLLCEGGRAFVTRKELDLAMWISNANWNIARLCKWSAHVNAVPAFYGSVLINGNHKTNTSAGTQASYMNANREVQTTLGVRIQPKVRTTT